MKFVTCVAPVNISVVKYWGKRDEKLILPLNDSIGCSFSTDQMCAKTTVATDPSFGEDRIWLNGKAESMDNARLQNCLTEIRSRAKAQQKLTPQEIAWKVHICSENNFPTAAGLASSAAGYACLVYALAQLYGIEGDISAIARTGSGSACRSTMGGFVYWARGSRNDGSDSIAQQFVDAQHWPNMRVLILVVSDNKKKTSSANGMANSVRTSELLKYRTSISVPEKVPRMKQAIVDRDFHSFAEITIRESNQFHAVCLDTYPPCIYMNDVSHAIADLMHKINGDVGENVVAYTYDAGPNACLYLLEENVPRVLAAVNRVFPTTRVAEEYHKGLPFQVASVPKEWEEVNQLKPWDSDILRYIIHTKIGDGPKVVPDSLIDDRGEPLRKFLNKHWESDAVASIVY